MKTLTFTAYNFSELNDKAKDTARQWFRDGMQFESDSTTDDAKQIGALLGFSEMEIFFSGFYSQGDGACFAGQWRAQDVTAGKVLAHAPLDQTLPGIAADFERIALAFPHASFSVKHRGHYYHQFCTDFTVSICDASGDEIDTPAALATEKALISAARDFMQWIYRQLEKDCTWQNSNEAVDENIACNDYLFTETGKRCVVLND